MTTQQTNVQPTATNGSGNLAARIKNIEALRLIGIANLNGDGDMFAFKGRETSFYRVPVADKNFWERAYGRVTIGEGGCLAMETKVGSYVNGVLQAERYMEPGRWYMFAPSTKAVFVSERVYGIRGPEIIQSPDDENISESGNENATPNGKLLGSATLDNLTGTFKVPAEVRGSNVVAEIRDVDGGYRLDFYRIKDDASRPITPSGTEYAPHDVVVAGVQEALNRMHGW